MVNSWQAPVAQTRQLSNFEGMNTWKESSLGLVPNALLSSLLSHPAKQSAVPGKFCAYCIRRISATDRTWNLDVQKRHATGQGWRHVLPTSDAKASFSKTLHQPVWWLTKISIFLSRKITSWGTELCPEPNAAISGSDTRNANFEKLRQESGWKMLKGAAGSRSRKSSNLQIISWRKSPRLSLHRHSRFSPKRSEKAMPTWTLCVNSTDVQWFPHSILLSWKIWKLKLRRSRL